MEALKVRLNHEISSLLSLCPEWLRMINQAIDNPQFDIDYIPRVIEVFDQYGLLAGRVNGCLSYESTRTIEQESKFIAWLIDGELAVFYVGSELIINRLQILSTAFGELL
jgi:hypothetical protein